MATISEALAIALQHQQAGRLSIAEQIYRQILAADPLHANAHNNLGVVLRDQGRIDEAITCYRQALGLKPDFAEAYGNLGTAWMSQGRLDDAVACYRRMLELRPHLAAAHFNLGLALKDQGRLEDAAACYGRALELKPNDADAYNNLGIARKDQGRLGDAVTCYRRALELRPNFADAHNNLGNALKDQGRLDDAVASYRRALELKPDFNKAHSNLLAALQYRSGVTLAALATAHAAYDRTHAEPLRRSVPPHENSRDPQRRLRLGFVSPDFACHPVGFFLVRMLENLDREQCEIICYNDRLRLDRLTERLESAATTWRNVAGWSDPRLAEAIRADRIDILFDLAGHTARNRLLVFARRPAPIQVTWAGYVGTTGLKTIDYLLADRYEVPPEAEASYCERVLRMPDGYVCYAPPDDAPAVAPLPALTQGCVTFGCFNNPAKLTPEIIATWASILRQVPGSRLTLKSGGMNDASIAEPLAERFAAHGIVPNRLDFQGRSPHLELLAQYQRVDLALDPFPYNGGLTTCEALWMGVPVVTCPGETFASRHSLSHLSNVGLTETIAASLEDYAQLAVALAQDLPRLAALRAGLRERMAASPLCDGKRFARNLMRLLRDAWRQWSCR